MNSDDRDLKNATSTAGISSTTSPIFEPFASILIDPADGRPMRVRDGIFENSISGRRFETNDGIPNFFIPTEPNADNRDVTEIVKQFYEETPFPNYDKIDSRQTLREKAATGIFAKLLDAQLPDDALILEAGCGTGQLSNFLGMTWNRKVFAGDICLNSLRLAKSFADRQSISNVAFLQMNLFRPPFCDGVFDIVISNGVLHHTGDCEKGFRSILSKLKSGGFILIGLYNSYARLPTLWKSWIFRTLGKSAYFLDRRLRGTSDNHERVKAWLMDQYYHPHETKHSMGEVLQWFERYGVDYVNGIPHLDGSDFSESENLFQPHSRGDRTTRLLTQAGMLLSGGKDGGLYIMIGKKR